MGTITGTETKKGEMGLAESQRSEVLQAPAGEGTSEVKGVLPDGGVLTFKGDDGLSKGPSIPDVPGVVAKEVPPSVPSEKGPPPHPISEIKEGTAAAPVPEPVPEKNITADEHHPAPETPHRSTQTESETPAEKVSEKGHHPPETGEKPPPAVVEERPAPISPAKEPAPAEAEYLAPTKGFRQAPEEGPKEATPIVIEEKKPPAKGPPQTTEAERPQEAPPVAEPAKVEHPVVTEKEGGPVIGEKAPPAEVPLPAEVSPSVVVEKESPLTTTADKESSPSVTVKEPIPAEVENLSPTKDLGQAPTEGLEEAKPLVAEEGRPQVKGSPEAVEAEKPHEAPPVVEPAKVEPPVIAGKEGVPVIEEKLPPVEMPPSAPPAEAPPPAVVKEVPPAPTEGERPPQVVTAKEPPPAEVAPVTEKAEGVEPPAGAPETPEAPAIPAEPPKEAVPAWEIWQTEPAEYVLLVVAITLIAAKVGGGVARLLHLPEVVGKLIIGMLLGNLYFLTGWNFFNFLRVMPFLEHLSYFGALTLLLSAGLHTDLQALLRAGASSLLVCLGGLMAPAGLGFLVGHFLLPDDPIGTKLLLAIILCSSSTGLLLATLNELKAINTPEGKVLTGATILTDVIVILTFGVVIGVVVRGEVPIHGVIATVGIVLAFVAAIFATSLIFAERLGDFLTHRVPEGLKISIVAVLCLLLAFLAGSIGLVAIIGAFAAGLFLRHTRLIDSDGREYSVEWLIMPAYVILVPIFFVWMGALVDWRGLLDVDVVILGLAIAGAAFLGKLFCGVCLIESGISRMAIGVGMAMKLEGALILSGIGRKMGIIDDVVFSSLIMVIVLTSTVCPFLLKVLLLKGERLTPGISPIHYTKETRRVQTRIKRMRIR